MQALIDAIGSPIRREILWLVRDRELPAGEIAAAFEVGPSTISEHLAVLRAAGLVRMRVDGSYRRYRADDTGLLALREHLAVPTSRWTPADDLPERALVRSSRGGAVTVEVDLDRPPQDAYRAFTDPEVYGRWLGVPVTLRDRRFATTLEWGTSVRGTYEVVADRELLALRWDFDDGAIPVPGRELVTYVRFHPIPGGARVVVHQLVTDDQQAEFLTAAWSMVLGRLREGVAAALDGPPPARRARRPKRR